LSGGERRMLGIGMSLLRDLKLLLVDEPSSGLSPVMFQNAIQVIQAINKDHGAAVLLVEQNVKVAFKVSQRVYVMKAGSIILEDTGKNLLKRTEWWDLF
jgi:branched-chain amino acid transport system ATP-binding protein